ncbi:hypothetical protein U0035_08605 [Niabella yanshanensis]|uniref:LVIVD repeat-containing protein n=1 Tax=Niabella yanshanensis TaxID=577386 RepID=A0ABZ0WA87_9BACT|nr:hypothetical protein [Niabella yanshanensis]WQD40203.1 hypothetical protein U0035_08605 [Niabella yanshanensis]
MKHNKLLIALALPLLVLSCKKEDSKEVIGYAPIYGNEAELNTISLTQPQAIESGGKIYVWGHSLFQVESGKGIHVTDISNPSSPVKKTFIKVAGSQEVAVKNGLIYTNHLNDLVILEISGTTVNTVKRLPAFKSMDNRSVPPERGVFECPDKTKGTIIGWQKKMLQDPKCQY